MSDHYKTVINPKKFDYLLEREEVEKYVLLSQRSLELHPDSTSSEYLNPSSWKLVFLSQKMKEETIMRSSVWLLTEEKQEMEEK